MIFKVYFQTTKTEVPVRENTKSIYVEGSSQEDVRKKLADRNYNIEFVTPLSEEALEYEKQHEDYKVEQL
ncbi:DNA-dependent RNA polymerase auxiliary subunit epsilon family protein [Bacillus sp. H-16]|uniref:DNA-dependent RNA polymerase subunit epsilon n=1 Tax=Alteribacter salitolerans TaxID=2912333 RepID=UPI001962515B|nr:DNA-directed RNA polymerase subunit epsilon [Alteribacter salitolerans]MBM7095991.1 DNA-dependent RNA polymerase auxiliary subunit epsilon family protein [Alteribacter salitolerans]